MPEKPKQNETDEKEKTSPENCENRSEDNWSKDQREKSYYYDDSYGYEVYDPNKDDEQSDE